MMHPMVRLILVVCAALLVWVVAALIVGSPGADVLAWCVLAVLAMAGAGR